MINRGISFGWEIPGVEIVVLVVWLGLIYLYIKEKSKALLLVVIGGGLNLGERLLTGGVKDYWRIPYTSLYNNLADWLIFVGVIVYLWQKIKRKSK
jgi:lipoprotein signal peptidase